MDGRNEQMADYDQYGAESRYDTRHSSSGELTHVSPSVSIKLLEPYCSEFLIHATEHEGLRGGIDENLIINLGRWCSIPVSYAVGGKELDYLV